MLHLRNNAAGGIYVSKREGLPKQIRRSSESSFAGVRVIAPALLKLAVARPKLTASSSFSDHQAKARKTLFDARQAENLRFGAAVQHIKVKEARLDEQTDHAVRPTTHDKAP
jgi:hypothetical protein